MRHSESGFTIVEVAVAFCIMALVAGGAASVILQAIRDTERTNSHMMVVHNVENAGYWISRDSQMADSVQTDGLTSPAFLILKWTDWGYGTDSVYHAVTYSIEDVSQSIGKIRRTHQSSLGDSAQTVVAQYVYYNPADPDNTTKVSYASSILTLKVVTRSGSAEEIKEYKNYRRPNF